MRLLDNRDPAYYQDPNTIPEGAHVVGVIERDLSSTGALVRLANGQFVQMNADRIRTLPQRTVMSLLYR